MADNARGKHVSPGVYTREVELDYSVKSIGITTLGVAGETLKGPAFQPISIENWTQFQDMFGGTSTEKFKDTQYPKYELPYIAKSYLTESKQLEVCRVLGLSGYNAGPAWVVTASKDGATGATDSKYVVAVIRSRGGYVDYQFNGNSTSAASGLCECPKNFAYDKQYFDVKGQATSACTHIDYFANNVGIAEYIPLDLDSQYCKDSELTSATGGSFGVSSENLGRFTLTCTTIDNKTYKYSVTLNPQDNDYILKVLGDEIEEGSAPIYVESLYDVGLSQLIEDAKVNQIDNILTYYEPFQLRDFTDLKDIDGFLTKGNGDLSRRDIGKRYLYNETGTTNIKVCAYNIDSPNKGIVLQDSGADSGKPITHDAVFGQIYTVRQYTDSDGKRQYVYTAPTSALTTSDTFSGYSNIQPTGTGATDSSALTQQALSDNMNLGYGYKVSASANTTYMSYRSIVYNKEDGFYYRKNDDGNKFVYVDCDLNNYKEAYRYASTPWFVSDVKGDYNNLEVKRLFRFHTISDGDNANKEIKVSIANIRPDSGEFDVIIRKIDDIDAEIIPLEQFTRCTLVPGTNNYLGYKVGTFDGNYETKSKYVTVEINEDVTTENSVPCGFLGYPQVNYSGVQIILDEDYTATTTTGGVTTTTNKVASVPIKYNVTFDEDIKNRRQYFGLSDLEGVDVDMFTYKGNTAYIDDPEHTTDGFHLDSRLAKTSYKDESGASGVTVDGESGYTFQVVGPENTSEAFGGAPMIETEAAMAGTIYSYVNLRKFTAYFYGGFDGWDKYRGSRTNTDNFKITKYNGQYNKNNGVGYAFDKIKDPESLDLNQNGITSDWYAYLSAYRKFANPEAVDINVFATPGIDLINNTLLADEVISMLEEERADAVYVATTPDKPSGAGDYVTEMYSAEDIVDELADTEIDSNYTCTYFPWVKYFDQDNYQYINLPVTKDVVRNMAQTDNSYQPWYAPAGINRGDVVCESAHIKTKLADEDVLYEGRINPVKTFAADGVKVWGQKTLQVHDSQLNRIAIRRLLLRMRKLVSVSCRGIVFNPLDPQVSDELRSAIVPIMDNIKSNRGITDYRLTIEDTLENRARLELPCKLYVKCTPTLEYIPIDFILTPEGVSFDAL